jgi:PAS domain S-box-containing protein
MSLLSELSVLDALPHPLAMLHGDWRVRHANPCARELLPALVAGSSIFDLVADPDDAAARCRGALATHGVAELDVSRGGDRVRLRIAPSGDELCAHAQLVTAERGGYALDALQPLLASIPDMVWLRDTQSRFLAVNEACAHSLGLRPEDMVGTSDYDYFSVATAERYRAQDRQVLATGQRLVVEEAVPAPEGRVTWFETVKVPFRDASGAFAGTVGIARDITARRRAAIERESLLARELEARTAAEAAHRRLEGMLAGITDAFYALDGEGRFTFVNPAGARLLNAAPAALIGTSAWTRLARHGGVRGELKRALRERVPVHLDTQLPALGIWAAVHVYPWADGVTVYLRDVTATRHAAAALREVEMRFHTAFDRSAIGMMITGPGGQLLEVNRAFQKMLGYGAEELVERHWQEITHPDDVRPSLDALQRLLDGTDHAQFEKRYLHRDGRVVHALVSVGAVRSARGSLRYFVTQVQDITERARLERELRQAQKMETVGRLAGGIAHDFNNLLTVIGLHCELLQHELSESHPLAEGVTEIQCAAQRASALTRQLLAFSRRQIHRPRPLDLNATVRAIMPMLDRLIGEDIRVDTCLDPADLWIVADVAQLEQALVNLTVNARDAMAGGGTLTIATAVHAAKGSAVLTVRDTGCGMDEVTRAHVFEPFFTTKPAGRGTGLGLSTVYGIVDQNGGTIACESTPGMGTTFTITLPTVRPESSAATGEAPCMAACPRGSETILLVEDEDEVRDLARGVLERQGYAVIAARDGEQALELAARAGDIDLLLTDAVMPGPSARSVAERLAAERPALRTLYISGYTDDEMLRRGLSLPSMRLLPKPFSTAELATAVRAALDERS